MTQAEFLKKLAVKAKRTKWQWTKDVFGVVRCGPGLCPIEFVANRPRGHWEEAARELGMSSSTRTTIVRASDGQSFGPTRRRILEAVGLAALMFSLASPAMAHDTPKEKPAPEVPVERPVDVTPQTVPSGPGTADMDGCRDNRPECRNTNLDTRRPIVKVTPQPIHVAPFLPMTIRPHATTDFGAVERRLIYGKPEVKRFSTCADRSLPRDCRVSKTVAVVKAVVKTVPKVVPKPKMQLPFGF